MDLTLDYKNEVVENISASMYYRWQERVITSCAHELVGPRKTTPYR